MGALEGCSQGTKPEREKSQRRHWAIRGRSRVLVSFVTLNVRLVAVAKVLHRSVLEHGADELFVGKLGADGGVALTVILYKSQNKLNLNFLQGHRTRGVLDVHLWAFRFA